MIICVKQNEVSEFINVKLRLSYNDLVLVMKRNVSWGGYDYLIAK